MLPQNYIWHRQRAEHLEILELKVLLSFFCVKFPSRRKMSALIEVHSTELSSIGWS